MLDARHVADHVDEVRAALARRSAEAAATLGDVAEISARRRELIARTEALQAERNRASQELGRLAKSDPSAIEARRGELRKLGDQIKALESQLSASEAELEERLLGVPNTPHPTTPDGAGSADNPVRSVWGEPPKFDFAPKAHWELGATLGVIDFERASKLSGPRFAVLWGAAARMERALITFMLDLHTREHGYKEVYPPFLVKAEALRGTGQLPKFETDLFKTYRQGPEDDKSPLYLIPTAEVPVTNLHADEILEASALPLAYVAYTPCFRSEAGSYGKDVRGLIRQHQFDKVELVRFCEPSQSLAELELLTSHAEAVLQRLGLHYRKVALCAGDLGFSATKTYDLEVWLPSQNEYREISSCSSFSDYQARRARIRYKPDAKAKPRIANTLNGSGLAVGRTLVAIFEQYQQADGTIVVPEPLRAFMGTDRISAGV